MQYAKPAKRSRIPKTFRRAHAFLATFEMNRYIALCILLPFAAHAVGFDASEGSLVLYRLASPFSPLDDHVLRRDGAGRYFVSTGVEGLPSSAAWEVVPNEECAMLRSVPPVQAAQASVVAANDRALPPLCAAEFEGTCTSRDGRLRVFTRFEGTHKVRRVRSGVYGGEGWMDDKFYSGRRVLGFEDVASGKRALFVERLKGSRGYSAPSGRISYLPEPGIVLVLGIAPEKKPLVSYCIRLPPRK